MATIAILGVDGYTGWPLTCHLLRRGDDVLGVDTGFRRHEARPSVTPIVSMTGRETAASGFDGTLTFLAGDVTARDTIQHVLDHEPDAIVNLAQIPSAPYSMRSMRAAWHTQRNNVAGALALMWALREHPERVPVVQLATMGEYGVYPDGVPIPEGFLADGRPAPKSPGSFYHASKAQATLNTRFAAETWGLPVTEVYQGIVYGLTDPDDERLLTRFDVDATWGTVLNRFTAQAVAGEPLTVYGRGGQKRAMLPLTDCIRCITLLLDNPPDDGYRAVNQFQGAHRIIDLATYISGETGVEIEQLDNPRAEDDSYHSYDPERETLDTLGYEPSEGIEETVARTLDVVERYAGRIPTDALRPDVEWR